MASKGLEGMAVGMGREWDDDGLVGGLLLWATRAQFLQSSEKWCRKCFQLLRLTREVAVLLIH